MLPFVRRSRHNYYSVPLKSTQCLQELWRASRLLYPCRQLSEVISSFYCILLRTGSLLSCIMHTTVISSAAINYFKNQFLLCASQILADFFNLWWEIWMNLTTCISRDTNIKNMKAKKEIPSFPEISVKLSLCSKVNLWRAESQEFWAEVPSSHLAFIGVGHQGKEVAAKYKIKSAVTYCSRY